MKDVVVLGATGSIGANTLAVIREHPDEFRVVGLAARRGSGTLAGLAREFPHAAVAVAGDDAIAFDAGLEADGWRGRYFPGPHGAEQMVRELEAELCVAGIGGIGGIAPTFAAAEKGMRILLANKEVLVSAGRLFMDAVAAGGATVLSIDSEHCALWQCLEGRDRSEVERIIITASGGPFRTWPEEAIAKAGPEAALKHPVWRMGAKISIDSATLANKALELVEAQHLFGLTFDALDVLVHPQSTVHGMVEFTDGSLLAHMGVSDMRQPISYMLFYPQRRRNSLPRLDLAALGRLDFEKPDCRRFPLLAIGMEAGRRGGRYPALFNAANETAVELFLDGRLDFPGIARTVAEAMELDGTGDFAGLGEVAEIHEEARQAVLRNA